MLVGISKIVENLHGNARSDVRVECACIAWRDFSRSMWGIILRHIISKHVPIIILGMWGPAIFFTFYGLIFAPSKSDLGKYKPRVIMINGTVKYICIRRPAGSTDQDCSRDSYFKIASIYINILIEWMDGIDGMT